MKWNAAKRRYEDEQGKPIPRAQIHDWLESYIDSQKQEIESEADSLIADGAKAAAILAFFSFLRDKVKEMHGVGGVLAYGGEAEMSPERWARIGDEIASEYGYLEGFQMAVEQARAATDDLIGSIAGAAPSVSQDVIEEAILMNAPNELPAVLEAIVPSVNMDAVAGVVAGQANRLEMLIWGEVSDRGRMYADATYSTYANQEKMREADAGVLMGRRVTEGDDNVCDGCEAAASEEYVPLDELLDIGSADCLSRCRCWLEFDYHGIEPLQIDREVYA